MSKVHDRNLRRFREQMQHVDEVAQIVLKGHLLLEEQLERIIGTFVFHPKYIQDADLSFARKLAVARSMSLDEHCNSVWDLIVAINALRNELAHSLDGERRQRKLERLKSLYFAEIADPDLVESDRSGPDHHIVSQAVALALGFLGPFEEEVTRFKDYVSAFDPVVNPHRHSRPAK
jgi:hypothetical protein